MHPDQDFDPPAARRMRLFLVFLGIAGAILLFITLMRKPQQPVGLRHPGVGNRLESLEVQPLLNAEQTVTLADLDGKVTLINCWGPWCPPCLRELPELLPLEQKYRSREDVQFLFVSYTHGRDETLDDLRSESRETLDRLKADPPTYSDFERQLLAEVKRAVKADGLMFPTTVILDGTGKIRAMWSGYEPGIVGDMGQVIEQLLGEKR